MEQDVDMESVSFACIEVDNIHNSVCLLQQIECFIILFPPYELHRIVIQLRKHNRDFIL